MYAYLHIYIEMCVIEVFFLVAVEGKYFLKYKYETVLKSLYV